MRQISSLILLLSLVIAGCGGDSAYLLPERQWKNISFFVEVRPNPPVAGMNEVLVVATRADRKPAFDMIVSVSSNLQQQPIQTIQDGHSGIFRRAVRFGDDIAKERLYVHIQSREANAKGDTTLSFPLKPSS
jgi:hypothetical protein